jgi:transcriptional regulator with XRE-family HTH domain
MGCIRPASAYTGAMDAKQVIDELKTLGLSEYEIAKRLKTVSQSTVNRIATGETPNPSYRVWRELSSLLAELTITRGAKPPLVRASA